MRYMINNNNIYFDDRADNTNLYVFKTGDIIIILNRREAIDIWMWLLDKLNG